MTKQKMSSEEVINVAIAALEEVKGADILTIDVRDKTSIADYMLICTGTSNRQLNALVDNVRDKVKAAGLKSLSEEGKGDSDWVLLDLGDVIVHVMTAAARQFYDLERLWQGAEQSRAASAAHHTPGNE
ncbi:ribosome-associated protein IOJAP [Pseudomonas amygdali pv. tabaci str. ATCC 11528]|jgi:ribosome-associated protein|uniref:Ribosomal silencing factor RsfS n=44 Tax=Pseudomonas TaxID=286 RepID=A0A0Q0GVI4_PSEAJ|nr:MULTISPECIES: ribosome silencing factor [Pseudomonas]EGH20611.1 iojap domain-containing protein [Pseudomonas amygdali pv. mori str. 301020]KPB85446.1 Ribosomal silencing factor RsfS [Pseudomonas syringae pv. maculicola]KPW67218.1 Ribosomal silencing factor RsfS [Pseudomonas syringae pv. broussonetiae]KPX02220.1 Ribosomal silencing factor RsfS [Pseudomonas syringae pv. cunninghamiae]MCW6056419.1 ribosome silencing factor [Pseudomonas fragi]